MSKKTTSGVQAIDHFFIEEENKPVSNEFFEKYLPTKGVVSKQKIEKENIELEKLTTDEYISTVFDAVSSNKWPSAKDIIARFNGKVIKEIDRGPLYALEIELVFSKKTRRIGIIAQNRKVMNGSWMPEQHNLATTIVREFCAHGIPIVTFLDTQGADAGAEANSKNQAHSISRLVAEMANAHVPTVGIIYGFGYSGGAIPLATTNLLLAVRGSAFNTIQPQGLANIARQYNLSWQESARYVGMSPAELYKRKIIQGVIDWSPADRDEHRHNLLEVIQDSIDKIEKQTIDFVQQNNNIFGHYQRSVQRFVAPTEALKTLQMISSVPVTDATTRHPNIFGHACSHLKYLNLKRNIVVTKTTSYGRLSGEEIPKGDLKERLEQIRRSNFSKWLDAPDKIVYNEKLLEKWNRFKTTRSELNIERNKLTAIFLGEPQSNYEKARYSFCFEVGLYLYNRWKSEASNNFSALKELVKNKKIYHLDVFDQPNSQLSILDTIYCEELSEEIINVCQNMVTFDALYNSLINNFVAIAEESRHTHVLTEDSVKRLLEQSLIKEGQPTHDQKAFSTWLGHFAQKTRRGAFLKVVEEWKRVYFPRLSDTLLVLITFFFERLLYNYLVSRESDKEFDGKINPVHIGKRKDFWNQLDIAYKDVLIQGVLNDIKKQKCTKVQDFIDYFFEIFDEQSADLMTSNPINFPGFRLSIEKALSAGHAPCGLVTGIGQLKNMEQQVGVAISNTSFQAGAFDMASAEKLCNLLVECCIKSLPVVCFISSGGMQTKEGPQSLFSMAVVNDRITRFVRDNDLPIIVFGFADCTGGSQASFVTHPLVQTYYFSGADLPFSGRVVVPSFLPSRVTLSNYLCRIDGAMRGIVKHPFAPDLDHKLRDIDPEINVPTETVEDVIGRVFTGEYLPTANNRKSERPNDQELMKPIDKVLIHARGCTAVKLIRVAKQLNKKIVLVASDPDMLSVPVQMLGEQDLVVCLGGQTSDESYLNADSVLSIAKREQVSALHPGIGFLSENANFAYKCRTEYQLNFIGPFAKSMQIMGNKSNAINTALSAQVPVVPGSYGILTSEEASKRVADEIGYPVLLKAVHGGGGKGIQIVHAEEEIKTAFQKVQAEARAAFGNSDLYMEKFISSMRHIEVQILRDVGGNTKILGLRDCSVQRNNQKVIEESISTMLPKNLEQNVYDYARRLADEVNYLGAGTVEFIFDIQSNSIYFMEMNTRLQVEHPVTEWTTGISIVAEQFNIAEHQSIEHLEPEQKGYAIEVRVTAEKAQIANDVIQFIPTPGMIKESVFPEYDFLEVIQIVDKGLAISPFYDSLIAQVICYGEDRNEGIKRILKVLNEVQIKGVCTNIPLLKKVLVDKTFINGNYDTTYLEKFLKQVDTDQLLEEMTDSGDEEKDSSTTIKIPGTNELKVLSPLSGIFYSTPSPTEAEYVSVGSKIYLNDILCQIEAMKIFSHVSLSSISQGAHLYEDKVYKVVQVNQLPLAQVSAGDLLFIIAPDEN